MLSTDQWRRPRGMGPVLTILHLQGVLGRSLSSYDNRIETSAHEKGFLQIVDLLAPNG